ncbi:MAG TPA: hypothetical protein VLX90_02795 [Steroidobacteraceae bacterium]|nr:hypothetical protein [Steroidobacteraceae bacterium]
MAEQVPSDREGRGLAAALAVCSLATLTLLASHPSGGARSLADVLRDEAQSVAINGIVHGGFVVTLAALIVCFLLLSRRLGSRRVAVVVGLATFCIGSGLLIASMILDGFVTPALAVRFADSGSADNLLMARTLFIFCGTVIRFLMPIGILFQSAAMLGWSAAILKGPGLRRSVGAFGLGAGAILIIGLLAAPSALMAHVLLAGIALQAIWYLALAALLSSRASWPVAGGSEQH